MYGLTLSLLSPDAHQGSFLLCVFVLFGCGFDKAGKRIMFEIDSRRSCSLSNRSPTINQNGAKSSRIKPSTV